jgi:phosphatidylethanolamine N-methyltransferase
MSTAADLPADSPGLRLRQSGVDVSAQQEPQSGQGHSCESTDAPIPSEKSSKTYGRTPDGTGM